MATENEPKTIIIGAGIIGLSTAYYLTQSPFTNPKTLTLLDTSPQLFTSASGYAGGFLAKDWFSPSIAELGALSFTLHRELAEQHNGHENWGYSRSTGTSLTSDARMQKGGKKERGHDWLMEGRSRADVSGAHEFYGEEKGPAWLVRREGDELEVVSEGDSTAQVDPRRLCEFLLDEVRRKGVEVRNPVVSKGAERDAEGMIKGIKVSNETGETEIIEGQKIVITAGAWSGRVFETLFPDAKKRLGISSLAGHSLVVRSPRWMKEHEGKGCHAVFATDTNGFSPEIFSRIGGEIYIAGLNDASLKPPDVAGNSKPDVRSIERLKSVATQMLGVPGAEDDLEVVREGLCFRPVARGNPILGRIPDDRLSAKGQLRTQGGSLGGVFVAAGG
ncbi:MAG: hypothetical protein Q9159_005653 [Coniocarpon cinnabarinum]